MVVVLSMILLVFSTTTTATTILTFAASNRYLPVLAFTHPPPTPRRPFHCNFAATGATKSIVSSTKKDTFYKSIIAIPRGGVGVGAGRGSESTNKDSTNSNVTSVVLMETQRKIAIDNIRGCGYLALLSGVVAAFVETWDTIAAQLVVATAASEAATTAPEVTAFLLPGRILLPMIDKIWRIGFFGALLRNAKVLQQVDDYDSEDAILDDFYHCMSPTWRNTAMFLILASSVDVIEIILDTATLSPDIAASSSFVTKLWSLRSLVLVGFGALWSFVSILSKEQVETTLEKKMKKNDVGTIDQLSSGRAYIQLVRLVRNMALCVSALLLKGIIDTFIALKSDSGIVGKLLALSGVPTPIITALLLWSLRSKFLNFVTSTILKNTKDGSEDDDIVLAQNVFEAQSKFYEKVQSTFTSEVVIKILLWFVGAIVQPFLLPLFKAKFIST